MACSLAFVVGSLVFFRPLASLDLALGFRPKVQSTALLASAATATAAEAEAAATR